MKTVAEIRRDNLNTLVSRAGSLAELNEQLGRKRNHPSLGQIRNRSDRGNGTFYEMGDKLARDIEEKLGLSYGWMDTNHTPDDWPDDNIINLKRINIQACCGSAGIQNYEDDAFVEQIQVSRPWFQENISKIREQGYELITASGDSMEPTFRNGDLIVVDRQDRDLKRDGVFCVLVDGDLYIKRVQRIPGAILFISDNSLYRPFEIPIKEVEFRLQVLGRVVNSMNLKRYD